MGYNVTPELPMHVLGSRRPPWKVAAKLTNKTTALSAVSAYNHSLTEPAASSMCCVLPCPHALNKELAFLLSDSSSALSKTATLRLWGVNPLVNGEASPDLVLPTADYCEFAGTLLGSWDISTSASAAAPASSSKLLAPPSGSTSRFVDTISASSDESPSPGVRVVGDIAGAAAAAYFDRLGCNLLVIEALMASATGTRLTILHRDI